MSKLPISVCMIAKDEEKHIENCLKRLLPYGFEVIVTDTGSTDATKEIAMKYADKVLEFTWIDNFSAARNYCAQHTSNDWILALDCDEYIENIDVSELLQLIKVYPALTGALPLKHVLIRPDGSKGLGKDMVPRFYHKKYYIFDKPIHEQLVPINANIQQENKSFLLPMEVTHYGYALADYEMRHKQERNLKLLYQQLETDGESAYICFQIGQSELILEHCDKAITFFEKGLTYQESPSLLYIQHMIQSLAKAYIMAGRNQDALTLMEQYQTQCDSARYVFYHGNVLLDNGEKLKALSKYVKATLMHDTYMLEDELMYCYRHIIDIYHDFGEDSLASFFQNKYEELIKEKRESG